MIAIARTAAAHTSTPSEACIAVWEGHGWLGTSAYWMNLDDRRSNPLRRLWLAGRRRQFQRKGHRRQAQAHRELDERLSTIPKLDLQIRSHYLTTGPVDAAPLITTPGLDAETQVPDLWWPHDRAWFVATDTDLDWTVIGGSQHFVQELLRVLPERSHLIVEP